MPAKKKTLAEVKTELANKNVRLANVSGSKPRRAKLMRAAEKFRRQAADLAR